MIDCIFTLDYEIYGNGTGQLRDLVFEPAQRLQNVFRTANARFVAFIEVAELAKIEAYSTDPAIADVKRQVRDLFDDGFEIGLHLHPQWCNARHVQNQWRLDYSEYNLCTLARERVETIVDDSLEYLAHLVGQSRFVPMSFRAGNWLFQPTRVAAEVLVSKGIRVDSSVFKGGLQRSQRLDYRKAPRKEYYWRFSQNVVDPDPAGQWLEFPIHTEMVAPWRMATSKRLSLGGSPNRKNGTFQTKVNRALDLLRPRYPLKFDFCRMTLDEMTSMVERVIQQDRKDPSSYRPLVAIGHTKDLLEENSIEGFLKFLNIHRIPVVTLHDAYAKVHGESTASNPMRGDRTVSTGFEL